MTSYIKPVSFRLPPDAITIIQRIRSTGEPGREVSSTDAVVIALHEWVKHDSRTPEEVSAAIRALQERADKLIGEAKDV